jgi:Predicted ATPase
MKKIITPYKRTKNNLLLTKTANCWAYYQLPPVTISENNEEGITQYKEKLEEVYDVLGKYPAFRSQILPTSYRLDEKLEELSKDFSDGMENEVYNPKLDFRDLGQKYIERTKDILKDELGQINEYTMYVAVKLKAKLNIDPENLKTNLKQGFGTMKNSLYSTLNLEVDTSEEDFDKFIELEDELYNALQIIDCERVSSERLEEIHDFSFHHNCLGGKIKQSEVVVDPSERAGFLKIMTADDEFYLATLPIAETKDLINYLELFKISQKFPFATEFYLSGRPMNKTIVKNKINLVSNRFKETDKAMYQNEDEDDEIVTGKDRLNTLRNKVNNQDKAMFEWLGAFVVVGKTLDEVRYKARELKNTLYQQYKVKVVQPLGDQLYLFYKFLQGQSLDISEPYWLQYTTSLELAEFGIGLTKQLGSYIGWYLGRNTEGKAPTRDVAIDNSRTIVLFHAFLAHEGIEGANTDSPHIAILGQTGKGKSFLVKMLFFCSIFMKGKILLTDPKSEFKERLMNAYNDKSIQENYPEFIELVDRIKILTLDPDKEENRGILDPLNFLHGSKASDTILDIFSNIVSLSDQQNENELRRTVEQVLQEKEHNEQVGMLTIVERLENHKNENIRLFGENIMMKVQNSILSLVFGYGTNNGVSIQDKVSILEIEGLELPDNKTPINEQSETEQKSVAVMIALAKFCEEFGKRDKHEKTTIIFDEAWTLTSSKGGKKLVKSLRRVGRSYANQLMLVTQSVDDISDDEDNGNFGACFFFDEPSERGKILKYAGLPDNSENQKWLSHMKKGQCLFRDFYGRIDELSIDCLFAEWNLAFATTDKSNSGMAEQKYSR